MCPLGVCPGAGIAGPWGRSTSDNSCCQGCGTLGKILMYAVPYIIDDLSKKILDL